MLIDNLISKTSSTQCSLTIEKFLRSYMSPAFGALPKAETELLILQMLIDLNLVDERPSIYELISKLKITQSKARKLVYERELRARTEQELDADIKNVLLCPVIQKRGESFALEIDSPLLIDHIRARMKKCGHLSDGSFSPSLVTLKIEGMICLIEHSLTDEEKTKALGALHAAGLAEKNFKSAIRAMLKKLGQKVADDAGSMIADEVSDYMHTLFCATKYAITQKFEPLFKPKDTINLLDE